MLSVAESYSCSVVLKCQWFFFFKGKNQQQMEHSKYIFCNVYFFLVWDSAIHLASCLSLGQGLQEKIADSFLRSKLTNLFPQTDEGGAGGIFNDPWGCRVAHFWRWVGRKLRSFLLATQAALSLTQKQPWLLPPTPTMTPCCLSQPEHRIDKRGGTLLLRPDQWQWPYWGKNSVSSWVSQFVKTTLSLTMLKCQLYHTLTAEIDLGLSLEFLFCSLIWVSHLSPATQF